LEDFFWKSRWRAPLEMFVTPVSLTTGFLMGSLPHCVNGNAHLLSATLRALTFSQLFFLLSFLSLITPTCKSEALWAFLFLLPSKALRIVSFLFLCLSGGCPTPLQFEDFLLWFSP